MSQTDGPRFSKMQGLGNDFAVFEAITQPLSFTPEQVRQIADRRFGVGCDQVLLAEPSNHPQADFRYRIWNADGSEVEHCGNGVRCMARFLRERGLTQQDRISFETGSGLAHVELLNNDQVQVDMGPPVLDPESIPFSADARADLYTIEVDGATYSIGAASMGNPHAVLRVDNLDNAPVATLGPALEGHPRFPRRVNVGFMEVIKPTQIRLRVFERGAGETLACGTGACAAVVVGIINHWLETEVAVDLPGGRLVIHWAGEGKPVWMTGPAVTVFEGQLTMEWQ